MDTKESAILELEFFAPPILELRGQKRQISVFSNICMQRVYFLYCSLMWFITFSC